MATEGKLMGEEGASVNVKEATQGTEDESRVFHHKRVKGLAIAQIIVGVLSVGVGIGAIILSTKITCQIYCWDFYIASLGAGIWQGFVFICVGIVGIFAAKKKTNCWIVTSLTVTSCALLFAASQISLSALSAAKDRKKIKYTDDEGNDRVLRVIPAGLFALDLTLVALGSVMIGLLIATLVTSCAVTNCCCSKANHDTNTTIVTPAPGGMQQVHTNTTVAMPAPGEMQKAVPAPGGTTVAMPAPGGLQQVVSPAYPGQGGQVYYVPQGYGNNPQAAMQPMVLVPANSQAAMQYQMEQQCPPYQSEATAPTAYPTLEQVQKE